jgi:hypothetical protein
LTHRHRREHPLPAFNLEREWVIVQSNGPRVTINLHRIPNARSTDWQYEGSASYGGGSSRRVKARTEGDGPGSTLTILIPWENGPEGEYHGTFSPFVPEGGSRLTGYTFDRRDPRSQAGWHSDDFFRYVG